MSLKAGSVRTVGRATRLDIHAFKTTTIESRKAPRGENVSGAFFVDRTCIDCDTCRWMAPSVFAKVNGQSAVIKQPTSAPERVQALQALLSCPTHSIQTRERKEEELRLAQQGLPAPVEGCSDVFYCGWHTEKSFAGTAYFIRRETGNILVDSPRFNPILAKRLEELGGVKYMFLTHRDDVGDHEQWAKHFNCTRVLHESDVVRGTQSVEMKLTGAGPWHLDNADDLEIVHTPGHTPGHTVLHYKPSLALFTGDHLCADYNQAGELYIFEDFNWYSVSEQLHSVKKLLDVEFLHVLPAHGRMAYLKDSFHRLKALTNLLKKHGGV